MADDPMDDFVPYEGPIVFDPDDYFYGHRVASGRAGYFSDAEDQQTSMRHRIGHFWIVEPRRGNPDLISYLETFADAPRGPDAAFELPLSRDEFDRAWAAMDGPGQHLTPHHRRCWQGRASTSWSHGSVHYDPVEHLWSIHVAASLAADDDVVGEVRQRFVVDRTRCVIVARDDFEGMGTAYE